MTGQPKGRSPFFFNKYQPLGSIITHLSVMCQIEKTP